MYMEVDL